MGCSSYIQKKEKVRKGKKYSLHNYRQWLFRSFSGDTKCCFMMPAGLQQNGSSYGIFLLLLFSVIFS